MGSVLPRAERRFTPVEVPPLRPGDLLLVRTPRAAYGAGRWLGKTRFDHAGVLLHGDRVLNIVRPRAVVSPLSRMLVAERAPCALRPGFRSDAERDAFVKELQALAGCPYDVARAVRLVSAMLLRRMTRIRLPLRRPTPSAKAWICTDAILLGLERHVDGFAGLAELPLDWNELGCGSTEDFLRVCAARPDLLSIVHPPAPP